MFPLTDRATHFGTGFLSPTHISFFHRQFDLVSLRVEYDPHKT